MAFASGALAATGVAYAQGDVAPGAGDALQGPALQAQVPTEFWLAGTDGTVLSFGGAAHFGGLPAGTKMAGELAEVAPAPDGAGYWLVSSAGEIFSFGDAHYYGSTVGKALAGRVVSLTPTPDAMGYWVATSGGEVFSFGDARFFGTASGRAQGDIVGLVATRDGDGYWMLSSDGRVYNFGDAGFFGPTGSQHLAGPVVDMAPTADGHGYWLLGANGDVYSFGDATYAGGSPVGYGDPAEKIVAAADGGYWVVDQNGTAWPLGGAKGAPSTQGLVFRPVTPGDRAVLFAFSQLGKPYIWGGTGPKGFDCSGLAYRSWYVATGSYIPRISDNQYAGAGTPVPWSQLRAGDLIFWGNNRHRWQSVYHTAMYVGGSQVVESTGGGVQLNSVYQWGGDNLMLHGVRPRP